MTVEVTVHSGIFNKPKRKFIVELVKLGKKQQVKVREVKR